MDGRSRVGIPCSLLDRWNMPSNLAEQPGVRCTNIMAEQDERLQKAW